MIKIHKLAIQVLAFNLLFISTVAHAGFFGGATSVTNNAINGATQTTNNTVNSSANAGSDILALISKLSDDIGVMSNRILAMADKIGKMADRIVATEKLMTQTLTKVQENNNILVSNSAATTSPAILNTPWGTQVNGNNPPPININHYNGAYMLYASPNGAMDSSSMQVLIHNESELITTWLQLKQLANNNLLYIAVRTVNGNQVSGLSNAVQILLQ